MPASATRSVPSCRRSFLYATSMALTTVLAGRVFAAGTMILSESAAIAVDQALREGTSVQRINPGKLRSRLLDAGQIL